MRKPALYKAEAQTFSRCATPSSIGRLKARYDDAIRHAADGSGLMIAFEYRKMHGGGTIAKNASHQAIAIINDPAAIFITADRETHA